MHLRRAGLERVARVGHGRRFVYREFDAIDDVFGFFFAPRHDGRHRFADEAHNAVREYRLPDRLVVELVQHRRDFLHVLEISRRDYHCIGRCADISQLSGGYRAAHETHPMGGGGIRCKAALPSDQSGILKPADGAADPRHAGAAGAVRAHDVLLSSARRTTARTRSRR